MWIDKKAFSQRFSSKPRRPCLDWAYYFMLKKENSFNHIFLSQYRKLINLRLIFINKYCLNGDNIGNVFKCFSGLNRDNVVIFFFILQLQTNRLCFVLSHDALSSSGSRGRKKCVGYIIVTRFFVVFSCYFRLK